MRRVRWAALCAVLLAACTSGHAGRTSPASTASVAPADAPLPSVGCTAPRVDAGDAQLTITSSGAARTYFRHVPPAYDGTTAMPLVLDFHGYAEGADLHRTTSGLGPFGDAHGFVTLTPQGAGAVALWDTALGGTDLRFVGDLLDEAERTLCIDQRRVFATGYSNGAFLASSIACQYADRIAAIAPVAGVSDVPGCAPARPVPVVAFHGTADPFVAYDGGFGPAVADLPAPDGSGRTLGQLGVASTGNGRPPVPDIMAKWAALDGCGSGAPVQQELAPDVSHFTYPCPAGVGVELYRVNGGGHTWPGSRFTMQIANVVGSTTTTIDADTVMWAFFQAHPRLG